MEFKDMKIDRNTPIPMYYQLKQIIIKMIENSEILPGESIPTEHEFLSMYGISRTTVRQAILEMVQSGYLYRIKGKGTFVAKPKLEQEFMERLEPFNEQMCRLNIKPSTKVISLKKVNGSTVNKTILAGLELKEEEDLIYLERLRYANGEPIVLVKTYLPMDCSILFSHNLEEVGMYQLLSDNPLTSVVKVKREVESVLSEKYESDLMNISKNNAIQLTTTIGYNIHNLPIEYSIARYRGDKNKFIVHLYVSNGKVK